MLEMGLSGLEGGVALTRHPYPYPSRRLTAERERTPTTSGCVRW